MEGTVAELDEVKEFMGKAIASKCEGIMVKVLDHEDGVDVRKIVEISDDEEDEEVDELEPDKEVEMDGEKKGGGGKGRRKALLASYEPDKRADSWLKVKKDYGELGDSLDLVPIGAWHGQGRKAGWWCAPLVSLRRFVRVC